MTDRHTASSINDAALTELYDQLDHAKADMALCRAQKWPERLARAEAERDQHAALLHAFIELTDVTHRYRSHGGHDTLGEDLSCAGCTLRDQARTALDTTQADAEGSAPC